MKKYLFLMLLTPLAYAESNIYRLDTYHGGLRVLCINTFVFVKNDEGGITQMMTQTNGGLWPVKCEDYKKTKKKILAKSYG